MKALTSKEKIFVKKISEGFNQKDSAKLAGYSAKTIDVSASRLMRKEKIRRAFERIGLTENYIAKNIKIHVKEGLRIKNTADTSLRALELSARMSGYLDTDSKDTTNNTSIYINELKALTTIDLHSKLDTLLTEVNQLK